MTTNSDQQEISQYWSTLSHAAIDIANKEPVLANALDTAIINQGGYHSALRELIVRNLTPATVTTGISREALTELTNEALSNNSSILLASIRDLKAIADRDPACRSSVDAFLFYRGFKALQSYRIARYFWEKGRVFLARQLQAITVESYSMDIHPGARIEDGVFIDHGTGIVIGETARVERNVSILHNVTLGGTGKSGGIRHPLISEGVMLGAGAKVLGNITVGKNCKVAAGSIVLQDIPDGCTAVGIPARAIKQSNDAALVPAYEMKQGV
jgi:serine O-acetyltransferase